MPIYRGVLKTPTKNYKVKSQQEAMWQRLTTYGWGYYKTVFGWLIQFSLNLRLRYKSEHSKTFWKILIVFLTKRPFFMLHLHSRNHSECSILHLIFQYFLGGPAPKPPSKIHGFMLCAPTSQNSGGLVQICFWIAQRLL